MVFLSFNELLGLLALPMAFALVTVTIRDMMYI